MSGYLVVILVILVLVVVFQIAKASEYVTILRGEKRSKEQSNKVNAFLMIFVLILGLIGVYVCNNMLKGDLLPDSASKQGEAIDSMMTVTLIVTGIVFLGTQILLFFFAFRYQHSEKRKALYYPDNNKLEMLWTIIPAIVLTILVAIGLKHWFEITSDAPSDAMVVEVTGHQFNWIFRYPGKDGVLGKRNFRLIDPSSGNPLGQDWTDPSNRDDVVGSELHLVVNKPVKLAIGSEDVIHDVGLPYFRLKMDAVPGIPTTMWFTPIITTKEMIKKTGDPDFVYKLVCDQLCGKSHFSMTANIIVETQAEYDKWVNSQKPEYQLAMGMSSQTASNSSKNNMPADSTKSGMDTTASSKPVAIK